jgi:hypothetical protein
MKKRLLPIFLLGSLLSFGQANSVLPVTGMSNEDEGVFAYSIKPDNFGHMIPAPYNNFGNDTAYYYLASSDFGDYNPGSTSGMHGNGSLTGFDELAVALNAYGYSIDDIKIRFSGLNLGLDRQGIEWDLKDDTETRTYATGNFAILLGNDSILTGMMPDLEMTIDYNDENTPFDDQISAETDFVVPSKVINNNVAIDSISRAFYNDCKVYGLQFEFTSIQRAGQTEVRSGNLVGAFFEIPSGNIRTGNIEIPDLGPDREECDGSSVQLDAGSFDNYLWSTGATDPSIMVSSSGVYYVKVDTLGITYTSEPVEITFDICTSMNDPVVNNNIYLFPNPSEGALTISANASIGMYGIYDITGKLVVAGTSTNTSITLLLNELEKGVYLFKTEEKVSRFVLK